MAVAALAACTKSEVQYEPTDVIGFAPVTENLTKSVAGVNNDGTHNAVFPTSLNLYVFANAQDQEADGTLVENSWTEEYFKNAKFIYEREGTSNEVYEGETPRYWPNVKSLIFAGYSNACNINDIAVNSKVDFDNNTITINGYVQDNTKTEVGANDLMWFPWNGQSYKKQANAVAAQMKHACSWITVKVVGDATTGGNWKLHNLDILGLYHTGNATCGATAATWVVSGTTAEEALYTSAEGDLLPTTTEGAQVFENNANNMVVLPQVPTTMDVTYSYVPQVGVEAITEIKNVSLTLGKDTDGNEVKWESGKHYIYTVTITATEILIAPQVDEWVDQEVSGSSI